MTFSAGTEAIVLLNGYNVSPYLRSASANGQKDMLDTTTFGLHDRTFIGGLRNSTFAGEGIYDGTLDAVDQALSEAMEHGAASVLTYLPSGDAFGNRGKGIDGDESQYDIAAPVDGVVSISLSIQSSTGNEPLRVLATLAERSASGNGTALDGGAGSSNGASAFLQATEVGASLDVTIEDSADGSTDWQEIGAFTTLTDRGAERILIEGAVRRFVRATWDPDAYPATFHVGFSRK